jgi:ATP-dependent Clp protease ATP-binding subunit ClpA
MKRIHFTKRVRRAVAAARADARRRGYAAVAPDQLALSLLEDETTLAHAVLQSADVNVLSLRTHLNSRLSQVKLGAVAPERIPLAPAAKRVLKRSVEESSVLRHAHVGSEHVLLALVNDTADATAALFAAHGLTPQRAKAETLRLLASAAI